jgi:phosphonate transport system substrate-binding protein
MPEASFRIALAAVAMSSGTLAGGAVAQEAWDGEQPFRIGMVAHDGSAAVEGLSAIKAAYSRTIGAPVEVVVARDYATLVAAHADGKVDYAIYSAAAFAAATLRCGCVRAIVAPVARNGSTGIRSVLVTRVGGGAAPGPALGPRDSLAGRLAPLALHPDAGSIAFRDGMVETQSLSEAEARFVSGDVGSFFGWVPAWQDDTGAPAGGTLARLRQAGMDADELDISWQSEPIRYGPHAVRSDLDEASVDRLRALLTQDPETELVLSIDRLYGGAFVAVDDSDYAVVVSIVEAGGN